MHRLVRVADGVAGVFLGLLLSIVVAQILARAMYRLTSGRLDLLFTGAIELASYALLLVVFSVLPGAVFHGLVRVELFSARWPLRLQRAFDGLALGLTAAAGLAIASQMARQAWRAGAERWTTQEFDLPLAAFYGYAGVMALLFASLALVAGWRSITGKGGLPEPDGL